MTDRKFARRAYFTVSIAVGLVAGALSSSAVASGAAGPPPDLSGVWSVFWHDHPGGRFGAPAEPKLSAEGKTTVDEFSAKHDLDKYDPGAYCVPAGMPVEMFGAGGYPYEIIQQPKRITILVENDMQVRRIFMDGRSVPNDYPHTRGGYSIAHWDGDTLVVETALIKAWPTERWPHSDETHVVERISLKKTTDDDLKLRPGLTRADLCDAILVDRVTATDPKMYDGPQTVTVYFRRVSDKETLEYDCPEGNWWDLIEKSAKKD
jgi:hypothetical protein